MNPTCEAGQIGGYTFTQDGMCTFVSDQYHNGVVVTWVTDIDMFLVVDCETDKARWVDQLVAVRFPCLRIDFDAVEMGLADRWLAQDLDDPDGPIWIFDGKEIPEIQKTRLQIVFVLGELGG